MSAKTVDGVDVRRLSLAEAPREAELWALLEPIERQRADQYRHPEVRRRFLVCRAALRLLLARRLMRDPASLRLVLDRYGKPRLADPACGLFFNLSHAGDQALIALSDAQPVGVDLEAWRASRSLSAVARRCFSEAEFARWRSLPEIRAIPNFFTLWTRKEAFAKAAGKGISIGMRSIEFDAEGRLVAVPSDCGRPQDWRVQDLPVGDGFSAALAFSGPAAKVTVAALCW